MAVVTDLQLGYPVGSLASLGRELSMVNRQLWSIEDDIRDCERRSCFDQTFVDLARSVYRRNDERARLKKMINLQTGSVLVEVIFRYPGLGNTLYQAIKLNDFFVIRGMIFIVIVTLGLATFIIDVTYPLLDPRVSYKKGG